MIAAEKEARDLGPLLGQLADCARDEAKMHTRVWVDRAKTRTSVRVIAACVVAFAAGLLVFSRRYLEPYDTVGGQAMLLVIAGVFAGSLVGMRPPRSHCATRAIRGPAIVITGLLLGVGLGVGLYLIGRGLLRRHVPLADRAGRARAVADGRIEPKDAGFDARLAVGP